MAHTMTGTLIGVAMAGASACEAVHKSNSACLGATARTLRPVLLYSQERTTEPAGRLVASPEKPVTSACIDFGERWVTPSILVIETGDRRLQGYAARRRSEPNATLTWIVSTGLPPARAAEVQ